ncbi:MAG: HEPN domain-containing protein [bacterium]|nr:HEPN domain-containing protein [bacterium]
MTLTTQKWVDQGRYDLDTAAAMLDTGRYLYVLFCCQQALEKILKGIIVQRTGTFPPRIHNLLRLTEMAGLELTSVQLDFLGELSAYYIQSRYPEEIEVLGKSVSHPLAEDNLKKTQEIVSWLLSMIA